MKNFIVKDLMIRVLPVNPSVLPAGCDAGCTHCSDCTNCLLETPGGHWWDSIFDPMDLAQLKQQLREVLAVVEAREKLVHESMRPTSATEIDTLRTQLRAALKELERYGGGKSS